MSEPWHSNLPDHAYVSRFSHGYIYTTSRMYIHQLNNFIYTRTSLTMLMAEESPTIEGSAYHRPSAWRPTPTSPQPESPM